MKIINKRKDTSRNLVFTDLSVGDTFRQRGGDDVRIKIYPLGSINSFNFITNTVAMMRDSEQVELVTTELHILD